MVRSSKDNIYFNKDTGERMIATRGQNFVKMYIRDMSNMLEVVGGKKVKVIIYILKSIRLTDNTLIKTQREIAKDCEVSTKTVNETIKALCNKKILKKRAGAYMLSPRILYRGDGGRQINLMDKFETFDQ